MGACRFCHTDSALAASTRTTSGGTTQFLRTLPRRQSLQQADRQRDERALQRQHPHTTPGHMRVWWWWSVT